MHALRPSELAALTVDQLREHPRGRVIELTHSKTNQTGKAEHVVIPQGTRAATCPIRALDTWLRLADISQGAVFRGVTKGNRLATSALSPDGLSRLVTNAVARAGHDSTGYSGHSLRAGFVTYASTRGATAREIAHQTRHRALSSVGTYTRIEGAWDTNAATSLGL